MAINIGEEHLKDEALQAGDADTPMSNINVTPMVDVMLVLLIIFLITVPVVIQNIPLKLPDVRNNPTQNKPTNVTLSVRAGPGGACEVYWGMSKVTSDDLVKRAVAKLKADIAAAGGPQNMTMDNMPEAHIRGDQNVPYKCIGGVISDLQLAGFMKVGFISQPNGPGAFTS